MTHAPLPILLAGDTPPDGFTLTVDAAPGGYAGATLLSTSGPPVTLTLNGQPVTFPRALTAGDVLVLQRTDASGAITTVHALTPLTDLPPTGFTVTTDPDGFQIIAEGTVTTDPDGFQTITNATAIPDPDGFETVERST